MNPLAMLLPALATALNSTPMKWNGVVVPAEQQVDGNTAGHYVLISQPTDADAGGRPGCMHFSCTVLLDVVTQFRTDAVSAQPAESIVSQVHQRLRAKRLPLGEFWDCLPGVLSPAVQVDELDGSMRRVRRLLRYRWEVYYYGDLETVLYEPEPVSSSQVFTYPFVNQQVLTITHNLGRQVVVQIYNQNQEIIEGDVVFTSLNAVQITFSQSLSGTVVLR